MSTEDILNFRKVNDAVITGGQPTKAELESVRKDGFQVVINLATSNPEGGLQEEAELVQGSGMEYFHIPVDWEHPRKSDFDAFESAMRSIGDKKVLIHCAANFRVTTFYALYALRNLGWSEAQADEFRLSVWSGSNYPVWETFYDQIKALNT